MAENPAGVRIVEIRAGNSQRPVLELRPGEPVQPMSIGRVGMWTVDAPDVLDVHAYVYFDGRVLFLQSADPSNPAKGNGQGIGATWQQIEIPCTIEIGRARLVYRTLEEEDDEDDKTVAQAIQLPPDPMRHAQPQQQHQQQLQQPQFRAGGGMFSNRQPDDEATRLAPHPTREPDPTVVSPLEMAGGAPASVPKARPAAGMPAASMMQQTPMAGSPVYAGGNDIAPISSTTIGPAPAPPPPQTGYQAFGSVQVAVPAPPPAPGMMPQQQPMMQGMGAPYMPAQMGMPGMQPMPNMPYPGQMQPGMQGMGSGPYPPQMQGMQGMPGGPMLTPSADTSRLHPPEELKGFAKAKAEWNAMPPLRKLIIGTFPGVALLVYFMLFDDPPPQPPPRRPVASASASASAAPSASIAATSTATSTTTGTTTTTAPTTTDTAPTATIAVTTTAPTATAPIPTATTTSAPLKKGKKTIEREAIDLAGAGQYQKAADLYEQLATEHPEQPAYHEAAKLLRARVNPP